MAEKQLHPGAKWLFKVRPFWIAIFIMFFLGTWIWEYLFIILKMKISLGYIFSYVIGMILIAAILIELYVQLAYKFWRYEFTDSQLRIERGIIWKRYSNIPYERIQNVDITRGIIARILGFSTVNIQTAGYSATVRNSAARSEGYIPAVSTAEAEHIREFIIKKITRKSKSGL